MGCLHIMAFTAFILYREGVFPFVVTGTARFAGFHVGHGHLAGSRLVWEQLGVAVGTLEHLQMNIVAEGGIARGGFKGDFARLEALVTFCTVCYGESRLTIVAGTAEFTFVHAVHTDIAATLLHGEQFRVAFGTVTFFCMPFVVECYRFHPFAGEGQRLWSRSFAVTLGTVIDTKGGFTIVAGITGAVALVVGKADFL